MAKIIRNIEYLVSSALLLSVFVGAVNEMTLKNEYIREIARDSCIMLTIPFVLMDEYRRYARRPNP